MSPGRRDGAGSCTTTTARRRRARQQAAPRVRPHDLPRRLSRRARGGPRGKLDRIKACSTYGELRAVERHLTHTRPPVSDDALRGLPDDEPFDWAESEDWISGAWPPLPTFEVYVRRGDWDDDGLLADLNANLTVLVEPSERHGDGAKIFPEDEAALVEVLVRRGYPVRRDDELLARLGWAEDYIGPADHDEE